MISRFLELLLAPLEAAFVCPGDRRWRSFLRTRPSEYHILISSTFTRRKRYPVWYWKQPVGQQYETQ